MADNTGAGSGAGDLFQRKATGLLRGWSVWDGFIYAAFSINLITLGLFIFASAPSIPDGSLIWAIVLSGFYLVFQAITYASLIAVMPRAGGDYVWMSRGLGLGRRFLWTARWGVHRIDGCCGAGLGPHLDRDAGVCPHPEALLLRGPRGCGDHAR